jgi:hypothetical protein
MTSAGLSRLDGGRPAVRVAMSLRAADDCRAIASLRSAFLKSKEMNMKKLIAAVVLLSASTGAFAAAPKAAHHAAMHGQHCCCCHHHGK